MEKIKHYFADKFDDFQDFVTDMSPLGVDAALYDAIIDTYSWVCFCLYAWNLVKTMHSGDGYVQLIFESSFIDLILVTVATFCITVFATGSNTDSVLNYGWGFLVFCIWEPFFVDYSNTKRSLSIYEPSALISPLSIFICIWLIGEKFGCRSRQALLSIVLLPAITFYLVFGFVVDSFGILYFVWALTLLSVAAIDLQLKIGHFHDGAFDGCILTEQFITIALFISIDFVFTRVFSVSKSK